MWEPIAVPAGGVLDVGAAETAGLRTYVLVAGGLDVPAVPGQRVDLHAGPASAGTAAAPAASPATSCGPAVGSARARRAAVPPDAAAAMPHGMGTGRHRGPARRPEFFTRDDIDTLFDAAYVVHFNSARTGVRLEGPRPKWARPDGGEAGLHPSNIHDNAYSVGALDFTGDTPILLGPDGPSLGGFVCPVTVVAARPLEAGAATPRRHGAIRAGPDGRRRVALRAGRGSSGSVSRRPQSARDGDDGVLARRAGDGAPAVTYRRSGDDNVLVEYGDMVLDLALRARVHALARAARRAQERCRGRHPRPHPGDPLAAGARRPRRAARSTGCSACCPRSRTTCPPPRNSSCPAARSGCPLCWDDPATREAIARYTAGVRDDAPWCPSNIEFIRRVNGLASQDDVTARCSSPSTSCSVSATSTWARPSPPRSTRGTGW